MSEYEFSGFTEGMLPKEFLLGKSQNCRSWKGILEIVEFNPLLKQSSVWQARWFFNLEIFMCTKYLFGGINTFQFGLPNLYNILV